MNAHIACCRYRPSLDDLLEDDMMGFVLRSAGLDVAAFREMMAATARRIADFRPHPVEHSAGEPE